MIISPTPGDLFAGRPPRALTARPLAVPEKSPGQAPARAKKARRAEVPRLPPGTPWLTRYEMALRYSELHHNARHVALTIALRADWITGLIAPAQRVGLARIADITGMSVQQVQIGLQKLAEAGFLRRTPADRPDQASHIDLFIPAALDPVRPGP